MRSEDIFAMGLGLLSPWEVKSVSFEETHDGKELHIHIDFSRGGRFVNDKGEKIEGAFAKGIDVSKHNGTIDWEKVKSSDVDFAIIRCGYGQNLTNQDDSKWKENADACTRLGIPFGTYIYSYAMSVADAES